MFIKPLDNLVYWVVKAEEEDRQNGWLGWDIDEQHTIRALDQQEAKQSRIVRPEILGAVLGETMAFLQHIDRRNPGMTYNIYTLPRMRFRTMIDGEGQVKDFKHYPLSDSELIILHQSFIDTRTAKKREWDSHHRQGKMYNPFGQGDFRGPDFGNRDFG